MEIGSDKWRELVIEGAARFGLRIGPGQADAFAVHAREMVRWTRVTNLTAITDPREIAVKHFVDSIAPAGRIPENARLLDVGSGAGFPGIALKIVRPSMDVVLLDSSRKKISFLKHVIRTLNLEGIDALHGRVEDLADRHGLPMAFDVVICRALTTLDTFAEMALPLLSTGGIGMALKGTSVEREKGSPRGIDRSDNSRGVEEGVGVVFSHHTYMLPFDDTPRVLVTFRRIKKA